MSREAGLRERKKARTRERVADVAAALFAEHGYDAVSIADVAHAAEVSDQTVYNYFPAKQDLVLDRADEIRERYRQVVLERRPGTSPADALRPLVEEDIDRYRHADPTLARGEFPAQCVQSPLLRRSALEAREQQTDAVADAITTTTPAVQPIIAQAHAAALISVIQSITDEIGARVLDGSSPQDAAERMQRAASAAFDDLDRSFRTVTSPATLDARQGQRS